MIEPSNFVSGKTMLINMAGVVAIAQSTTFTPQAERPFMTDFASFSPVILESRPIPTVRDAVSFPVFFESQLAKLCAIKLQTRGVRLTLSPSTPSHAIPRTSLPFCNFNKSFASIF